MKFRIVEAPVKPTYDESKPLPSLVMVDEVGDLYGFFNYNGDMKIVGEETVLAEFEVKE